MKSKQSEKGSHSFRTVNGESMSRKGKSLPSVPVLQKKPIQKVAEEEKESLQEKFTAQLKGRESSASPLLEKEENLQVQKKENKTGLPNNLKAGVENLSGFSMDDVRVYYNSTKPAQLNALAYAQGTDIHVGPGQEKHLPHEAWHVVQQMQGRVKPNIHMKGGVQINDDKGLENEADVMGKEAFQFTTHLSKNLNQNRETKLSNYTHHTNKVNQFKPFNNVSSSHQTIQLETWGEWASRNKYKIGAATLAAAATLAGLYIYFKKSNGAINQTPGTVEAAAQLVTNMMAVATPSEVQAVPHTAPSLLSRFVRTTFNATIDQVVDTVAGNSMPSMSRATTQAFLEGLDAPAATDRVITDPTHFGFG